MVAIKLEDIERDLLQKVIRHEIKEGRAFYESPDTLEAKRLLIKIYDMLDGKKPEKLLEPDNG
jgi:hypothetical protein